MATPGAELRPKADYFRQANPRPDNFQADKAEHWETAMDLQSAGAWAVMCLNRAGAQQGPSGGYGTGSGTIGAGIGAVGIGSGTIAEEADKSAAETQRLDTEMDRMDGEEPALDRAWATRMRH